MKVVQRVPVKIVFDQGKSTSDVSAGAGNVGRAEGSEFAISDSVHP